MQIYDLLMLLVLVGATLFGFWKGMAWQIASLASLVVSYFAALRFSEQLAPMISDQPWNRIAAMLLIYAGVSFIIWMMFRLVAGIIDKVKLESFDKQMGALIGLAKGVLLCVAITFFAVGLLPQSEGEAIVASKSGQYIAKLLHESHSIFPPEIHQVVDPYLDKIERQLNPNYQPHTGLQTNWPSPAQPTQPGQPAVAWPPMNMSIPQAIQSQLPQLPWPPSGSQPPATDESSPYIVPREPNPFPYSAEVPGSRDY